MGYTNSDLMEEIMFLCYEEKIIDDVRDEVKKLLEKNSSLHLSEAYEIAYNKFTKKNLKKVSK